MDVDHPERNQRWDDPARSETETERLDRNWSSRLQELRVAQTGVQLLTGFLLTLPFQQRFDRLDDSMRATYVATVACSLAATIALVAPVAMHRCSSVNGASGVLVSASHRLTMAGLALLGLGAGGRHRCRRGHGLRPRCRLPWRRNRAGRFRGVVARDTPDAAYASAGRRSVLSTDAA